MIRRLKNFRLIRFIYYIYNYRLLYYLPMERMDTQEKLDRLEINYDYLKEENEKLKKENKKLKLENAKLKDRIITDENFEEKLDKENKNLKEKVETLELWLDNKEKLNEEYRKQIDKYKRQYEHSMWEDDELIYEEWLYD